MFLLVIPFSCSFSALILIDTILQYFSIVVQTVRSLVLYAFKDYT